MGHLFQPMDGNRPLKADPRLKTLFCLGLLILVLSSKGPMFPALVAGLSMMGLLLLGARPGLLIKRLWEPLFIILVLIAIKAITPAGSEVYGFSIPVFDGVTVSIYKKGLWEGIFLGIRVLGCVTLVLVYGFTTSFLEVISALSWLRVPRLLIDILGLTYRFLFQLLDEAQNIYQAQKNRLGYCGVKNGIRSLGILAGSLVLRILDQSQALSLAMTQRGFEGKVMNLHWGQWSISQILVFGAIFALGVLVWCM